MYISSRCSLDIVSFIFSKYFYSRTVVPNHKAGDDIQPPAPTWGEVWSCLLSLHCLQTCKPMIFGANKNIHHLITFWLCFCDICQRIVWISLSKMVLKTYLSTTSIMVNGTVCNAATNKVISQNCRYFALFSFSLRLIYRYCLKSWQLEPLLNSSAVMTIRVLLSLCVLSVTVWAR